MTNSALRAFIFSSLGSLGLAGFLGGAEEWPSPVTWKPDERAVKSELYIKPHAAAKKERFEFTIVEPSGIARKNDTVRGGIPLFRGELSDPQHVRLLDADGKEVPVQARATAYWPEKTIRFLCVDFLTTIDAKNEKKFTLEYGSEVKSTAPAMKVEAKENGGDVSTGTAVFAFRPGKDFLKVSMQKPAKSFKPVTGRALVSKSNTGADPATHPLIIDTVEVTEKGCVQTTVHLTGHYGEEKSGPPGLTNETTWKYPASLFVRVYAGTGQAYIEHSFGYNGDEYSDFVQSYGLTIPTGATKGKFVYGADETGTGTETALGVRLNQYAHNEWDLIGKAEAKGKRFGGWGAIKGDGIQVVAALREAWQNWPVAITAGENGDLTYEIMGEKTGRALDLRYRESAGGNFFKSHSMNTGEELSGEYGDYPGDGGRAAGIIKIHELKLDFTKEDEAVGMEAQAHQVPLIPSTNEKRIFDTKAFGHLAVYGDPKYDYIRNYYSIMLDAFPLVHEANGLFGWVDWGDMPMVSGVANGKFKLHLEGGIGWSNGERSVAALFHHYIAGGGRRFYDLGRAMVLHTIGIDVEHAGGDWRRGGFIRHDQVHWREKGSPRQGGFRGWANYVWLSGDPEVERLMIVDGIDAPASSMVLNVRADAKDVIAGTDDQHTANFQMANHSWITTGDWRYARAMHGICRYWDICAKEGKRTKQGWEFMGIGKDGEPQGYGMGDPGPHGAYWCTYGGDDLLLDWASLTGDPAAVDAIIDTGKLYHMNIGENGYSFVSPEALILGVAYLDPTNPSFQEWFDHRFEVHANMKTYQEKGQKPPAAYASADEWNSFAVGDYGFGIFGSDGKNGYSIHGAEAREILMLMRAMELVQAKK